MKALFTAIKWFFFNKDAYTIFSFYYRTHTLEYSVFLTEVYLNK